MQSEAAIIEGLAPLQDRYAEVHETMRHLRRFWQGHMWQDEEQMSRSMVSVFRDLRHGDGSDREPDVKMTLPLIEATVSKFMALLVSPPQISMNTPPIGYAGLRKIDTCRALADQNEKFLYGLHARANVRRHFGRQGWYLPLMGSCFSGVHPDFDAKTVRFLTQSPENAYPVWDAQREFLQAIYFKYEIPVDVAARMWGKPVVQLAMNQQGQPKGAPWRRQQARNSIPVIEFYDANEKQTLLAGHRVQGVEHGLGYCPWEETRFYDVPDEDFGKGVIEGNVPLFQKLNMLDSLELQAIIENVFARLVIIDPAMAPEEIDNAAGGVIPVGKGGDVKWIAPPSTTTDLSNSMARSIDFSQKGTHLPPAIYGEGVATSITTGKAQHEATLPTGNIVEYVQGNIADTWTSLNEKAIDMTGTVFKNRKVVFFGSQFKNQGYAGAIERPEKFRLEIKGDDLKGWAEHELTFQPLLSMHEKIVMNLQLAGAGLVSKRYQRDAIGIVDNDQMQEEIFAEQQMELKLAALLAQVQAGTMSPQAVESAFLALEKGGTPAGGAGIAPPPGAMAGGGIPGAMPPMDPNAPLAPGTPNPTPDIAALPPGGPQGLGLPPLPVGAPPGAEGMPTQDFEFTLSGAVGDFSQIKKLKGRVWLLGEIVIRQGTDGPVEVGVEMPVDKATIINGLPDEYHGNLQFHTMAQGPNEPAVEVGPGHEDAQVEGENPDHPDVLTADGEAAPQKPNSAFQDQAALPSFEPPLATNFPAGGFQGTLRS